MHPLPTTNPETPALSWGLGSELDFEAAYALASEIEARLGEGPRFDPLWAAVSTRVDLTTEPAGATVSYRHYERPDGPWTVIGETREGPAP